jgi:hypothetical protein
MPETHAARFWHPSGMLFLFVIITGGVARAEHSLNHRLSSGKPPACSGDLGETALLQKNCRLRNIS